MNGYRGDVTSWSSCINRSALDTVSQVLGGCTETENIKNPQRGFRHCRYLAYRKSDLNEVEFEDDEESKNKWNEISEKIGFDDLVGQAVRDALSSDDGAFKISVDTDVALSDCGSFIPRIGDFLTHVMCGVTFKDHPGKTNIGLESDTQKPRIRTAKNALRILRLI